MFCFVSRRYFMCYAIVVYVLFFPHYILVIIAGIKKSYYFLYESFTDSL